MPLSEGLVSHYKLVENNLQARADATGAHFLYPNGVGVSNTFNAQIDRAAYFQESAYLEAANPQVHQFSGPFTISVRVRPEALTGQRIIVDKANDQYGREYRIDYYQNAIHFRVWDTNNVLHTVSSAPVTLANSWYHIVAGLGDTCIWIAVDGNVQSLAFNGTIASPVNPATFAVGSKSNLSTTYNQLKFRGQLDELSIWDRELSPADVTILYNNGAALPYEAYPSVGDVVVPPAPPSGSIVLGDFESEYIDSDALVVRVVDQFTSMSEVLDPTQATQLRDFLTAFLNT